MCFFFARANPTPFFLTPHHVHLQLLSLFSSLSFLCFDVSISLIFHLPPITPALFLFAVIAWCGYAKCGQEFHTYISQRCRSFREHRTSLGRKNEVAAAADDNDGSEITAFFFTDEFHFELRVVCCWKTDRMEMNIKTTFQISNKRAKSNGTFTFFSASQRLLSTWSEKQKKKKENENGRQRVNDEIMEIVDYNRCEKLHKSGKHNKWEKKREKSNEIPFKLYELAFNSNFNLLLRSS